MTEGEEQYGSLQSGLQLPDTGLDSCQTNDGYAVI